ncbi:peptide chain release factor family protein [Aspergillus candidus]|uniref:RF-1 domain-domain-containing protein n=1 Tax=Aspergillus candidus TaxID=41067 RepID=A0A2I2FKH5_ASPCN|nr:RF-1 domain-domain-containing protein [Aspergillus candidus]PLB41137.1 RF-1 domain-domain-containing protein [Aspergillus candidus]
MLRRPLSFLFSRPISRSFSLSAPLANKPLPPRLKIPDADVTVSYLKGSGPGGQKINKTNSAVQISHKPTGIVVKSQATRSQSQNEKIARQLLAERVEHLQKGDQSRTSIKADRARKKKASKVKKSRRKYRDLEGGEQGADGGRDGDGGGDGNEGGVVGAEGKV